MVQNKDESRIQPLQGNTSINKSSMNIVVGFFSLSLYSFANIFYLWLCVKALLQIRGLCHESWFRFLQTTPICCESWFRILQTTPICCESWFRILPTSREHLDSKLFADFGSQAVTLIPAKEPLTPQGNVFEYSDLLLSSISVAFLRTNSL